MRPCAPPAARRHRRLLLLVLVQRGSPPTPATPVPWPPAARQTSPGDGRRVLVLGPWVGAVRLMGGVGLGDWTRRELGVGAFVWALLSPRLGERGVCWVVLAFALHRLLVLLRPECLLGLPLMGGGFVLLRGMYLQMVQFSERLQHADACFPETDT